jgi:hypothetical protein
LSSKLDASASSQFQPSGNYQSALTFGYSGTAISSIDGSAIAGMGGGGSGKEYTGVYPVIVDNTADSISVDSTGLSVDETMSAYASGDDVVIGVNRGMFAPSGDYLSSVSVDSNMSGDGTTASPLGLNPIVILSAQGKKGFVYLNGTSAGSLTISGDTARFQGTGNKMMNVSFNCNPSAKGAIFIGPWNASNDWAGFSAQYSAGNINAYLRASGSGTAGLTFWDTDGSEQIQKSSIPYWNSKQDASGMTAYQPSGDYIYASALGIAEV